MKALRLFFKKILLFCLIFIISTAFFGLYTPNTVFAAACGAGDGSITFYDDIGGGQCIGVITGGTTFTAPSDWGNTNSINALGAGGNGGDGSGGGPNGRGGSGGGGGAYAVVTDTTSLSGGNTYDINIGSAHAGTSLSTSEGTWLCTTNGAGGCTTISDTNVLLGAQSGAAGAVGGPSGGAGGANGTAKAQNGGAGASSSGNNSSPGAGGGGSAGTTAGGSGGSGQTGGAGGATSGGASQSTAGAAGNPGTVWTINTASYGAGGGGAGHNAGGGNGGAGGAYGAGGGGAGGNGNTGGAGNQGIIVLIYTPMTNPPTVTTTGESGVTVSTVVLNGNITSTGGSNATVRGFAYGTDSLLETEVIATTTEGGDFGAGVFSELIETLQAGVTYYYRAYATNSAGTGYGVIDSFVMGTDTTPTRTMRLFEGFTMKLNDGGRIILYGQ